MRQAGAIFMRVICLGLWFALLPAAAPKAQAATRVVSMNLCTDQLAMLLAAPAQLISVSHLARDPESSSMVEQAQGYAINHGRAEEIVLLKPDLVLAGTFTTSTTLMMLKRLGYRVEQFAPETTLADIETNLRRMGAILGRAAQAEAVIAQMRPQLDQARLAALSHPPIPALAYYTGGYTAGAEGLASDMLAHAGARNIAQDLGFGFGGVMSLEALVLASPQLLVHSGTRWQSSRGAVLDHPALAHLQVAPYLHEPTTPAWTCGTPETIAVVADLARRLAQETSP